jgi:hypothetical protein
MMLHTLAMLYLAEPVGVPNVAPPNSANLLKLGGWILWGLSACGGVIIAASGAKLAAAGSGRGGQSAGEGGMGFVIACVGTAILFAAGSIASAMA